MEHAPAVGIGDRLADVDESVEEVPQPPHPFLGIAARLVVGLVELADRLLEADPADEPHGIERPAALVDPQAIDRHDPGMLQPAGDLGFQQEPGAALGIVGALGFDLLQRHLALELGVERDRDLADAALGVGPEDPEADAFGGRAPERPFDPRTGRPVTGQEVERAGQERIVVPGVGSGPAAIVDGDRRKRRIGARPQDRGGTRRPTRSRSWRSGANPLRASRQRPRSPWWRSSRPPTAMSRNTR